MPWPVWLTSWSYLLLTCHLLCAAVIVLLNACFDRRQSILPARGSASVPCHMKLSWFLFAIAAPMAIIVTMVYFTGLFPLMHRDYLNFEDANLHLMNTVLVILEFAISALPVHLLHAVYVLCLGLAYVAFSIVYWAFDHSHVMYPRILDWNAPKNTVVVLVIMAFVGVPILQLILFGVYQLRKYIYARCGCHQSNDY